MKRLVLVVCPGMLVADSGYGIDEKAGTSVAPFLKVGTSVKSAGMGGVGVASGEGDEGPGVTAGFGITYKNLTFDGAYLPAGDLSEAFRLSVSMRF
ncbi:hypothetical protein KJ693_04035 [bacterium]|nr:hypothetical protein [bacterium]MBU1614462.1 hypothetical protein [bacterium]